MCAHHQKTCKLIKYTKKQFAHLKRCCVPKNPEKNTQKSTHTLTKQKRAAQLCSM